MNLAELHQKSMNIMQGWWDDHKDLPTMFIGLSADGKLHILVAPDYVKKRDFYSNILAGYFYLHQITSYAFCSEAYMKASPLPPGFDGRGGMTLPKGMGPLKDDPEALNVLVTGAVDADDALSATFVIEGVGKDRHIGRQWEPPSTGKGPGTYERVGMFGLLGRTPIDQDPELLKLVKFVVEDTIRRGYFPIHKVLSPTEYDDARN